MARKQWLDGFVFLGVQLVFNIFMDRWGNYFSVKDDPLAYRKFCASLYLWTPGTPWMYYGEEVMMKGNRGATSSDALRRTGMKTMKNPSPMRPRSFTIRPSLSRNRPLSKSMV